MHIAILIPDISVMGGTIRVVTDLANYWISLGYKVTILTFIPNQKAYYPLSTNVNIVAVDIATSTKGMIGFFHNNVKRIFKLKKKFNTINASFILAIGVISNILLAISSLGKRKYIAIGSEHSHPTYKGLSLKNRLINFWCYKYLDVVVTLTKETANYIKKNTLAKSIVTIPNPLNYPLITHQPIINPKTILTDNKKILLAVGRLSNEKRHNLLINIFSNLAKNNLNWCLVILGDGELRQELETQIKKLNLTNKVFMPGNVGNLKQWYQQADLFVLSSKFEGLPCSLIEAMAYGLPCISFACKAGPSEIITHEVDGILVEPGNSTKLEIELNNLMNNKELRQKLAKEAVKVRDRYSLTKINNLWKYLFNKLAIENKNILP